MASVIEFLEPGICMNAAENWLLTAKRNNFLTNVMMSGDGEDPFPYLSDRQIVSNEYDALALPLVTPCICCSREGE